MPNPQETVSAGSVSPSTQRYVVVADNQHQSLNVGDEVTMVETPRGQNFLLRHRDMTLHRLSPEYRMDDYVTLRPL